MMDTEIKDIYSRLVLSNIKDAIKRNYICLNNELNTELVDDVILKDITSIFNDVIENKKINHKEVIDEVFSNNSNIMVSFMLYYTALYFDNLILLKELLKKGFYTNSSINKVDLYALDNRLSSKFELYAYVKMIINYNDLVKNFYQSLDNNNDDKDIIEKFCFIVKNRPTLLEEIKKNDWHGPYRFLKKENLLVYDTDVIMNSSLKQLDILDSTSWLDETSKERLLNLVKKHNFDYQMVHWRELFRVYTDDEILRFNEKQLEQIWRVFIHSPYYAKFLDNKRIEDLSEKEIKKLRKILNNKTRDVK